MKMALVYAILLMVVVIIISSGELESYNNNVTGQNRETNTIQTADEGVALYAACLAATVPAGNYTAASLSVGEAATTSFGNSWGCVKSAGGVYGSLVTTVTWLGPPTYVPGLQAASIAVNPMVQQDLAYQVAEALANKVQFAPNTIVGVLARGSVSMSMLSPAGQAVPVLSKALTYATPAIVGGLLATTPANNVVG